jgi:hypothetical protein
MSIVQWYKSQVILAGTAYPVAPNGANLSWDQNFQAPAIAGNFCQQNYIEGFQMPTMDLNFVLLDGSSSVLPITASFLNSTFMTRSNDYQHDISAITASFFDGFSGWSGFKVKGGNWSLRGGKNMSLQFSAGFAAFRGSGDSAPSSITSAPAAYTAFAGAPLHFQCLSFLKNGSAFDGINQFSLSYSNNLTPDMTMQGSGPQRTFPIDVNAGMPTASLSLTFQADAVSYIDPGDTLDILVVQNSLTTRFTVKLALPSDRYSRNVGSGRQMRTYNSGVLLGTGNTNATLPVVIAAA